MVRQPSLSKDIVNILLDTCTLIWILNGPQKLSPRARELWENQEHAFHLSAVSIWEIARKQSQKKLELPAPLEDILLKEMMERSVDGIALTVQASLKSTNLPYHHKDPFDRMLICQALAHDLTILTPDENFRKYKEVKVVW